MPVATAISRTFNQLTFYPKSLSSFTRTLTQSLDLTRKFFLTQARGHAKAPINFVIKRVSFLCVCGYLTQVLCRSISRSQEVFLVLVILRTSPR